MEEQYTLSEPPKGWVGAKLGDVCDLINGRVFKPSEWSLEGVPIVRIQNLNNAEAEFNYCSFEVESKYVVNNGQLLFGWSGTPETSFGAHIWNRGRAFLNQHIFKVEIEENCIDKIFLKHLLNHNVKEYIGKAHGTAGLAHITKGRFEDSLVALPPFNEQHRIASKVEELFSCLDAGVESLLKVKTLLKRYRQAVLKYAFEGKLTEEWRKDHKHEIEPAIKLLERIKQEKKEKFGTKYKELPPIDTSDLPELPPEWTWARIGDFGQVLGGKRLPKGHKFSEYNTKCPYIRVIDFDRMTVDAKKIQYLAPETHELIKRYTISKEDVYISIAGSIGKVGIIPESLDGANLTENAAKITLIKGIDKNILCYSLSTPFAQEQINRSTISSNQPKLALFRIAKIVVPFFSQIEQFRILEEIERRRSIVDETVNIVEQSLIQRGKLRQSILKNAFEGKLVPQDPSDEPAEKLLERIREERAESMGEKDPNKKKMKPKQLELCSHVK